MTPVKQPYPLLKCLIVLLRANKGILPPLYLQEHISQAGAITKGSRERVWGVGIMLLTLYRCVQLKAMLIFYFYLFQCIRGTPPPAEAVWLCEAEEELRMQG